MDFCGQVEMARTAFHSGRPREIRFRSQQLKRLLQMMEECYEDLGCAVGKDLRRNRFEVSMYELDVIIGELKNVLKNLKKYTDSERMPWNLIFSSDQALIDKVPYGVVLILGVWNFPLLCCLTPLIGAIAAGNTVILKPSEISQNTASVLAKIIPQYLDRECYQVVQADVERTKLLLNHKFDYIYCTGSVTVGKYVLTAAARHLTPVTLELGGKCPCFIHDSADFKQAVKRILWGKLLNHGQACLSPDYILCSEEMELKFVEEATTIWKNIYGQGKEMQRSPHLGRIINPRHCLRLQSLLMNTDGRIVLGGCVDVEDLWVDPTIIVDVGKDDVLMQEEIFGPILPIVRVQSEPEAVVFINSKPKPLGLYIFSKDRHVVDNILSQTSSGSVCVNDVVMQIASGLPLGGVGESGMGKIGRGSLCVDAFSHKRSIFHRGSVNFAEDFLDLRSPPYTTQKKEISCFFLENLDSFALSCSNRTLVVLVAFGSAMLAMVVYHVFLKTNRC